MDKQLLIGMLKSKTIQVNTWLTVLIIYYAQTKGVDLDPNLATSVTAFLYGAANGILRYFTNTSLPEKGITIPNPAYVQDFASAIGDNPDAVKKLWEALSKFGQEEKIKRKVELEIRGRRF